MSQNSGQVTDPGPRAAGCDPINCTDRVGGEHAPTCDASKPAEVWCSKCDQPATVAIALTLGEKRAYCSLHAWAVIKPHEPKDFTLKDGAPVCTTCGQPVFVMSSFDGDSAWLEHGDLRAAAASLPRTGIDQYQAEDR